VLAEPFAGAALDFLARERDSGLGCAAVVVDEVMGLCLWFCFLLLFPFLLRVAFEDVVVFQGAEFVDEAEADLAAHGGVAVAVSAFDFVDGEPLNAPSGQGVAGAGEVEGAGVVEAVEEIGTEELGEEEAFFVSGEGTDLNRR
jgi:hypothetical protein